MKISDLLHKIADNIAPEKDTEIEISKIDDGADNLTDAMVPPLQQELELKKRKSGISNAFDRGQVQENQDELDQIKRLTGL